MPFRAFGDVKFKWSIELQKRVLESGPDQLHENEHTKFIPPNYHTPPYLTAEPEITYHKLRPQDRFMVRGAVSSHTCSVCICYHDTAEQVDQYSDNQTELPFNTNHRLILSRLLIINGSFSELMIWNAVLVECLLIRILSICPCRSLALMAFGRLSTDRKWFELWESI